jgi:hypothetical protein
MLGMTVSRGSAKELARSDQRISASRLHGCRETMKYAPAQMGAEQGTANA